MTPVVVDPEALDDAGRAVTGVGDEFAAAVGTLASTIGGGAAPLTAPEKPGVLDTPSSPSSLGGGVMPPFLWSLLQNFIPDSWPDGDPGRLRASAGAWRSFASTITGIAGGLSGPSGVVGAQQIPEGAAMTSAISGLSQSLSDVATEAGNLATQTQEFADDVQSVQDAIRDLCDRISPTGILDGITAVFSGDALDEIKEIAHDVQEVLENFGRQVDGRISLMESLVTGLDDAVVSLQQGARREFTHYLGDDVGGALATALEFQSNVGEGVIKAGLQTVVGIQQLDPMRFASDFDGAKAAWGGVLDTVKYATPNGIAMDPLGAFDHGKDMLGGIVHAEDWRADRPGLGLGGVMFEAGSAATGVGAAKTGLRGVSAAADLAETGPAVRAVADGADAVAPIAGRASEIAGHLDDLTTFADDLPSGATPGTHRPVVPPALTEPNVPRVPETRLPESSTPQGVPDSSGPRSVPDGSGPRPAEVPPQHVPDAAPRADMHPQSVPDATASRAPEPAVAHSGAANPEGSRPPVVSSEKPAMVGTGSGATHAVEMPPSGSSRESHGPIGLHPSETASSSMVPEPHSSASHGVAFHLDDGISKEGGHPSSVHDSGHEADHADDAPSQADDADVADAGVPATLDAANSLNDAFTNGMSTSDLARTVADGSAHHVDGLDRVVLGRYDGQDGGYIGEARHNGGGIYFDTGDDVWQAVERGLSPEQAMELGWQINEQFLRTQLENGVQRIEYVLDRDVYSSLEQVVTERSNSFSAMEIKFLIANAEAYGYQRVGAAWARIVEGQE